MPPDEVIFQEPMKEECVICQSKDDLDKAHILPLCYIKYLKDDEKSKYELDSRILLCEYCYGYFFEADAKFKKDFNNKYPLNQCKKEEYFENVFNEIRQNEGIDKFIEDYVKKIIDNVKPKWLPEAVTKLYPPTP